MPNKYPYVGSSGHLHQVITQFRKSFPSVVNADLLKKVGIAPKNESYLINVIRFLGLIDNDGNRTDLAGKTFAIHEDTEFAEKFEEIVRNSYSDLFDIFGDEAWGLDNGKLISYFRGTDQSTEIVGKRQANTFQTLAMIAGKRDQRVDKPTVAPKKSVKATGGGSGTQSRSRKVKAVAEKAEEPANAIVHSRDDLGRVGLTVRIEINLPAQGDQDTYDRIFKSIKENLLNGT